MPDIAMCKGEYKDRICPYRRDCYRCTTTPDEYQTYFGVLPLKDNGRDCEYLSPNGEAPETEEIWKNKNLSFGEKTQKSIEVLKKIR